MTREVSLQEILVNAIDYQFSNVYTSIPGVILGVHGNLGDMRVDVQPTISMRNEEGDEVIERPAIINVPFQMPVTDLGGLTFPIGKGTPVWLKFSMRGLDTWKRGNGLSSAPSDNRKFDIRDCVAEPGTYPQGMSPNSPQSRTNDHDPSDVVLVHNIGTANEVEIRLKTSGQVIVNSPAKVEVNCKDAEVNAEDSINMNATDVNIESTNFSVSTTNYSVIATGDNISQGTFRFQGSLELNGTTIEDHDHGGVQAGGSRTNPFGT